MSKVLSKILPVVLSLLCACETEPPALEAPQILSITPAEQLSTESQLVTVQLDTDPRFLVDYGRKSVQMLEEPMLEIGTQKVNLDTYLGHGQFQGTVAPGLEAGRYAIRVTLGDGREATLPDAYMVKAAGEPDPEPVVGYWVENIAEQVAGRPFTITLRVEGPDADRFEGTVEVSLYQNGAPTGFSRQSSPFVAGRRQEQLTIDTPGDQYLVVVRDAHGNTATSNSFSVIAK